MTAAHILAGISFIDRNIYIYQHATARQGGSARDWSRKAETHSGSGRSPQSPARRDAPSPASSSISA